MESTFLKNRAGRLVAGFTAVLMVTSSLAFLGNAQPLSAAASTNSLITGSTAGAVARSVNSRSFPAGATTAVVSPAAPPAVITQAAALASSLQVPLVVSDSTSSATTAVNDLRTLKATHVVLFGEAASFTSSFKSAVAAAVTVDANIADNGVFARSALAASRVSANTDIVIARSDRIVDLRIAAAQAIRTGNVLILLDGSETQQTLKSFFSVHKGVRLSVFGDDSTLPADVVAEDQMKYYDPITTANESATNLLLADRAMFAGKRGNLVVAVPSDQPTYLPLAALEAKSAGGVVMSAGATASVATASSATDYLKLWATETSALRLVGRNLTSSHLATLSAPTSVARASVPTFRVADLVVGASSFTIQLPAVSGATKYTAYDLDGVLLASSSSPSLTIPGLPVAAAVSAENASGPISTLEFRSNDYRSSTGRADAAFGSIQSGTASLTILSTVKTPRVISRTQVDPFAQFPTPPVAIPVAITCNSTFTETGLDTSKQWEYIVSETNVDTQLSCSPLSNGMPSSSQELLAAGVSLPATTFPDGARALQTNRSKSMAPTTTRAAKRTLVDSMLLRSASLESKAAAAPQAAPGDGWDPFLVRYVAYIPAPKVSMPIEPTFDLVRPLTMYGGDNHGPGLAGESARFKLDTTITFGSSHRVSTAAAEMGLTYKYKCSLFGSNCIEVAQKRQVSSQVGQTGAASGYTSADVSVAAETFNPLSPLAPAIDVSMQYRIRPGGSSLVGVHDKMPAHEIFGGTPQSECFSLYRSNDAILPCLFAGPRNPDPVFNFHCRQYVNVQF